MSLDYTGFKLGEKKILKDKEQFFDAAQKQIKDKLGADWQLVVDWPTIEKLTGDTGTNERAKNERKYLGGCVYQNYCRSLGEEISKWGAEIVEAVNDAITDKKIIVTMDPVHVDARYSVKVGKSIEVLIQQEKICYEYAASDPNSVTATVEKSL